jgi:glucokinase
VGDDGTILARAEALTDSRRGSAAVLQTLRNLVADLAAPLSALAGIGVACAGQIHAGSGVIVDAPNLGWHDVPLAAVLRDAFHVPVTVENDVRAAAWGEFRFGAGRGIDSLVAVFVGTGVGSGAVLNGALWRGASNVAGEVGHIQVVPDGLPCGCGARGCLERYVSGSGFQQRYRADATAIDVYDAAQAGDRAAGEIWSDAVRHLCTALANYVTLVNPRMLVLGGGVIETVPALFDAVVAGVPPLATRLAREILTIERAQLGDWSGVAGAADLVARA